MRILISEDDYASRSAIANFLRQYASCDATIDGEEAVEAYKMALESGEYYDLVCLDAEMPFRDGYNVASCIRQLEKEYGVLEDKRASIIMTTAETNDNHKRCIEDGLLYCAKPINYESLKEVIRDAGFDI